MPVYRLLSHNLAFPPAERASSSPDGLLACGGDLRPERLLNAYRGGIFPWFNDDESIRWCSPDPRMVLWLEDFHVSRSMRRLLRREPFAITMNHAFKAVIEHCAALRWEGTWITPAMQAAYCRLHELGHAHSVEAWQGSALVGGLYGVALGRMFFGESMFSLADNASKLALEKLVRQLRAWGFAMIDCQQATAHMRSLGASEMPRAEFIKAITHLCSRPPPQRWGFDLP